MDMETLSNWRPGDMIPESVEYVDAINVEVRTEDGRVENHVEHHFIFKPQAPVNDEEPSK